MSVMFMYCVADVPIEFSMLSPLPYLFCTSRGYGLLVNNPTPILTNYTFNVTKDLCFTRRCSWSHGGPSNLEIRLT